MGRKAVYNKQYLAIYITREDFDILLKRRIITIPVVIGKHPDAIGELKVELQDCVRYGLALALDAERQVIREIQDQFDKDHPDYTSSTDVQRRQKRARKRLRKRTNDAN